MSHLAEKLLESKSNCVFIQHMKERDFMIYYSILSICKGRKVSGAKISAKGDQSFLAQ